MSFWKRDSSKKSVEREEGRAEPVERGESAVSTGGGAEAGAAFDILEVSVGVSQMG